jgi:hypothetical protein
MDEWIIVKMNQDDNGRWIMRLIDQLQLIVSTLIGSLYTIGDSSLGCK